MATVTIQSSEPSCLEWWQKAIIYQIYPRSFQDSNGDGIGDIPGILHRINHLVDIGIGAVWLSPFYPSPQYDFGYDISDFCDVDPMFGTLEDFDKLVHALHERGIKIIVDFVPGHSSHLHPWFQKSVDKEEPYSNYYVWHDGKLDADGKLVPPNNWLSAFGGSAWTWCDQRQQFYFRPFLKEQPKLNHRCPQLRAEMEKSVRFWLDRGVDGLRVDAINFLVEAEDKSLNEPRNPEAKVLPDQYEFLNHIYTESQPEVYELIQEWANILEQYSLREGQSKILLLETYEDCHKRNMHRQFGGVPFNMDLIRVMQNLEVSGEMVKSIVDEEYANLPAGAWPTFVLGNHDNHRIPNRHGKVYADTFNMMLLTLKGTPTTYYGEEIGMADIDVSYEHTQDPFGKSMGPDRYRIYSRDPARSPMQWDNSENAGFTLAPESWLPVSFGFISQNVKFQTDSKLPTALQLYKTLAKLRKQPAFENGSLTYAFVTPEIFSYMRNDPISCSRFLVVLNFGRKAFAGDLGASPVNTVRGTVVASTPGVDSSTFKGQQIELSDVTLYPGDGLVIRLGTDT